MLWCQTGLGGKSSTTIFLRLVLLVLALAFSRLTENKLRADQTVVATDGASALANPQVDSKIASAELAMTNAYKRVLQIVNKPVQAYTRTENMEVSVSKPGWFHDGASKPDFNTVDVRQSQEFPYAGHKFVSSDLNPGRVFLGEELEFNSMTKYFYTNRALPKRKLTESEMVEVNSLYRIIGKAEAQIQQLKSPVVPEAAAASATLVKNEADTETVVPGQSLESIRSIPKQTRIKYGSIAIGTLLILVVVLRVMKKTSS